MATCSQPALNARISDLCLGTAQGDERVALEAHLLTCDQCWGEFQRISEAIHVLRSERQLVEPVMAADLIQLVGLGARLQKRMAGHHLLIWTISLAYGLLMCLALLVEVAYEWDSYGEWALTIGIGVGATSTLLCAGCFELVRRRVVAGRHDSMLFALVPLSGWTLITAFGVAPFLSSDAIVLANFQTMTGRIGWIKSAVQALQVPLLSMVPFQFVLAMQYELWSDRIDRVLRLLTNDALRVTPRGTLFVKPVLATTVYVLFAAWWIIGTAHLLENLEPGQHLSLFMALAMTRAASVLLSLFIVLIWYARTLNDLKREAIAVSTGRRVLDDTH